MSTKKENAAIGVPPNAQITGTPQTMAVELTDTRRWS